MPRTLFADYPTRFSLKIAFLSVLGVMSVHAQVQQAWVARYNGAGSSGDQLYGIAVDTSGNVYVTGNTIEGPNVQSFTTIKYNSAGIEQWVNKTGTHSGGGQAIAVTPAGDVYVTGNFTFAVLPGGGGGTNGDFCTIKYDASGAQQWFVTYNGPQNSSDYAKSMALDSAGNVYVTGGSPGLTTAYDIATVKYSSAGVEQWVQRYTGPDRDNDEPRAIAVDRWGNVYVTGYDDRGPNTEWVTIKYSPAGAEEWVRRYGESAARPAMGNGIVIDSLGNIYVTGSVLNSGTNNDYTTIKYSPSGAEEWVRTYNGPAGNGDDYPYAIAIDRQGMIYVTGASYGGTGTDGDCTTIKYSPDGVELWVRRYNSLESKYDWGWDVAVDTSGNVVVGGGYTDLDGRGHFLTLSYDSLGNAKWAERFDGAGDDNDALRGVAVDLAGNAYVAGSSYEGTATTFDFATIKYSPQRIAVTRPRSGERWISGSQDTIRWTGGLPGEFLDIEYALDSGQPYRSIDLAIAADSGYYIWNHPDSLLSARARIRLLDFQSNTVLAESDTFRLKAYFLTRLDASGQYEAFLPAKHGWSFANSVNNFWPPSWWNQFQYAGGIDRHTGDAYSPIFAASPVSAQPQDFNDWPVFVDVFGRDGCFWFGTDIYRDRSVDYWHSITRLWNGSCFGVALTGLLYFHYREQFRSLHPTIPFTDSLGSIQTMTDAIRATINRYFAMQYGDLKLGHDQVNAATTPRQTLAWIRQMWANDNPDDDAGLRYRAAPPLNGGHAVIPYRLQRVAANPNQFRLYVCNSNNPTSLNDFILIDSLANTWQEFTGFGWGVGTVDMHPYPPAVSFFQPTAFYEPYFSSQISRVGETRTGPLWIATPRATDVLILSGNGDSTGIANGSVFNSMPGAVPMIPETGYPQPPIAYQVPGGTYKMRITNPLDSMVVLSVRTNRAIATYARSAALPTERDELWYDGSIGVSNPDPGAKTVVLQLIASGDSSDRTASIRNLTMLQDDSAAAGFDGNLRPRLLNTGQAKQYHLELRQSSAAGLQRFTSASVNIPARATHTFDADWDHLDGKPAVILVDLGNDGTVDDTVEVDNEVTGVLEPDSPGRPHAYQLAQNYPNPFNPVTNIRFTIAERQLTIVSVYDLLGREVATLVNEVKEPGTYEVAFDASGLASGVYLYRLQSGDFTQIRRMTVLK